MSNIRNFVLETIYQVTGDKLDDRLDEKIFNNFNFTDEDEINEIIDIIEEEYDIELTMDMLGDFKSYNEFIKFLESNVAG